MATLWGCHPFDVPPRISEDEAFPKMGREGTLPKDITLLRSSNTNGNDRAILKLVLAKHCNNGFIKNYNFNSSASQTFWKHGIGESKVSRKEGIILSHMGGGNRIQWKKTCLPSISMKSDVALLCKWAKGSQQHLLNELSPASFTK